MIVSDATHPRPAPVAPSSSSPRLAWRLATLVDVVQETERAKSLLFDVPGWSGHRAGQHVDVRLTAPDGYQAQRSYSIASGPADQRLALTVERLPDGEVSPYLVDELAVGEEIELRGPIGGYFVWEARLTVPVLLVAGGSGVVPLRAMLRDHAAAGSAAPMRLVYSARSLRDVIYRDELSRFVDGAVDVQVTLTREWPADWRGHRGRLDPSLLAQVAWSPAQEPLIYVCGPTAFVEVVTDGLVGNGHPPERIRTERFGASGG